MLKKIEKEALEKISLFCNVKKEFVIPALNSLSIYEVPSLYSKAGLDLALLNHLNINTKKYPLDLKPWRKVLNKIKSQRGIVKIGVVGKYTNLKDSYKSLNEALMHGGISNKVKVVIKWINAEKLKSRKIIQELKEVDGILIPGGFGYRGVEGKINAIKFARENKVPFFGICLGMQLAVIEIARNVLKIKDANSTEFKVTKNPVIGLMTEWLNKNKLEKRDINSDKGGTMRLGSYKAKLTKGSKLEKIYSKSLINERHRHRYEVNTNYFYKFKKYGYEFSGMSPDNLLPEAMESKNHPWFIGVQFHPELKSRPQTPHPLFVSFIKQCIKRK